MFTRRFLSVCTPTRCIQTVSAAVMVAWLPTASVLALTIYPTPPALNNSAYILMEHESGQILAAQNADKPLPPASMTKMMTSFIIEQELTAGRLRETDLVTMPKEAWCQGKRDESCMFVDLNQPVSVIDLLRGIIIQSGNDAAKAMAIKIGGDEARFAERMNQTAAHIGMKNTHFMNASGLPAEGHYASARDIALLGRAIVMQSPKYFPIYKEKSFTFNGIQQENRNLLLKSDPTVDGFKTGHTEDAGYCLASTAVRNNMRLIAVVMGTKSMAERARQSQLILDWGYDNYTIQSIHTPNTPIAHTKVWFGQQNQINAGVQEPLTLLRLKSQNQPLRTQVVLPPTVDAPIKKGQTLGRVQVWQADQLLVEKPLVALDDVPEGGFFKRMTDYVKRWLAQFTL